MSGVPPLSGFGGRWIFYNAILTTEARLPLVLIFLMAGSRFAYRSWKEHRLYSPLKALGEPVLVVGAGDAEIEEPRRAVGGDEPDAIAIHVERRPEVGVEPAHRIGHLPHVRGGRGGRSKTRRRGSSRPG
jgi:hypothetical protein